MVGSLDLFAGAGKVRFLGTFLLLGGGSTFQIHLDDHVCHRFGVPTDPDDIFIGQPPGLFAQQLTATHQRNRCWRWVYTFDELHGAPP
jgi:hypothetical protein